jgi:hypothetical protein
MNNQNQRPLKSFRSIKNLRNRRDCVMATKVSNREWEDVTNLAAKQGRTVAGLIRHLLKKELQRMV